MILNDTGKSFQCTLHLKYGELHDAVHHEGRHFMMMSVTPHKDQIDNYTCPHNQKGSKRLSDKHKMNEKPAY